MQKTAYALRISDWSSDVCSSDLHAFLENLVIFFRDQELTPEQHKAFGRRFGDLSVHPFVKSLDGHPEIIEIVKEPTDKDNFGGSWHSDLTFTEKPALGSILYAKEVPATGGDTMRSEEHTYELQSLMRN